MSYLDFCIAQERQHILPVTADSIYHIAAGREYHVRHQAPPDRRVLALSLNGKGKILHGQEAVELNPGEALAFDASDEIFECSSEDEKWDFWWFEFRCLDSGFLAEFPKTWQCGSIRESHFDMCEEALSCMHRKDYRTASLLLASLLSMTQSGCSRTHEKSRSSEKLLSRAEQYIHHNLAAVSVQSVARHLHISEHTLLNLFKTRMGIGTVEYIKNTKMEVACCKLAAEEFTIGEIAEQLGYADQFVFSKCFRKYYGVSPSEYRKKIVCGPGGDVLQQSLIG